MNKSLILKTDEEVFDYQNLEKEIFRIDMFNPFITLFPNCAFVNFDVFYLLEVTDWFSTSEEYNMLIAFLNKIGSSSFYASAPPFYMVNAIKVSLQNSFEEYYENHSYLNEEGRLQGVGIRKSPETLYYDETKKWAMVCDVTNNFTVVGLLEDVSSDFEDSFKNFKKHIFNEKPFERTGF